MRGKEIEIGGKKLVVTNEILKSAGDLSRILCFHINSAYCRAVIYCNCIF
ncbi:hypothetical protein B0S90_0680 [Caldicellulosiruptor bescii]|uniref:Uncharacterized protein n=2 Tax=Caldicellulosiruptor bescii TaxID=31899 RepID=B9MN82_CALBD|nr:hypothetical protein Athe_0404 [Caldicellulosiruptor bescii DSM 6725]PBC89568.1 hypothetical protein B0S87_2682 [Caldicellulosiruptor bescii]PBC89891.1 hypothetical protein B0S89_0184 [Caldicellulosiruptor bescii]PBD04682.1 hypothetical protein B0S85_2365 [Caldicellulosiruptor bescii]PBD05687.1 hypothetical protein B0S90_0680 [Caldicellulosiruptor bescii]